MGAEPVMIRSDYHTLNWLSERAQCFTSFNQSIASDLTDFSNHSFTNRLTIGPAKNPYSRFADSASNSGMPLRDRPDQVHLPNDRRTFT